MTYHLGMILCNMKFVLQEFHMVRHIVVPFLQKNSVKTKIVECHTQLYFCTEMFILVLVRYDVCDMSHEVVLCYNV